SVRAAVALEEVVDPGARALEGAVGRGDVADQVADAASRPRPVVHREPDAGLGDHLAPAEMSSPARAVPELLGAGLRADVLEVAEDAVAARLTAEHRPLEGELRALDGGCDPGPRVGPRRQPAEEPAQPALSGHREEATEAVEDRRHQPPREAALARGG